MKKITKKHKKICSNEELLDMVLPRLEYLPDKRAPNGDYMCKCDFHKHNHPDKYKMHVGIKGWYCNSAGEGGSLYELAQHLGLLNDLDMEVKSVMNDKNIYYDYTDEEGNRLFQVVRTPDKKFFQRQIKNGEAVYNLKRVRRVLYRLPDLVDPTKKEDSVYICEGEKDVDKLRKLGLIATCNPGGAGKWKAEHSKYLKSRDIIILPDNDDPGKKHAQDVARKCYKKAKSVRILELPDLSEKHDISDWLEKGNSREDLLKLAKETPLWKPSEDSFNDTDQSKKNNIATDLIHHIKSHGIELFHDERKKAYAKVKKGEVHEIMQIGSNLFKSWLYDRAWKHFGRAVGNESISTARNHLESEAIHDRPMHKLSVRYARQDETIYIDLDGHKAVEVNENGLKVIDNPPPLFRWFPHMDVLPVPAQNGDPLEFLKFLNISDEDDQLLLICYITASMIKGVSIPVLILNGQKGSAKTTAFKLLRKIIDPSRVPVRGIVPNQEEFSLITWQNRAIFFDNLNTIPGWFSDAICRAVTGEGYSKRMLYTDEDTVFFEGDGVFGLASINPVVRNPDLLDRALIINMDPITQKGRKRESLIFEKFDLRLPSIISGFYTLLAKTLKIEKDLEVEELPRMADFTHYGSAVAIALGKSKEDFKRAFQRNILKQNETAIEESCTATALIQFMQMQDDVWHGTSTELLQKLKEVAEDIQIDLKSKKWPKDASWLSKRLREVAPALLTIGIKVEFQQSTFQRTIRISKLDNYSSEPMIQSLNDTIETSEQDDDIA